MKKNFILGLMFVLLLFFSTKIEGITSIDSEKERANVYATERFLTEGYDLCNLEYVPELLSPLRSDMYVLEKTFYKFDNLEFEKNDCVIDGKDSVVVNLKIVDKFESEFTISSNEYEINDELLFAFTKNDYQIIEKYDKIVLFIHDKSNQKEVKIEIFDQAVSLGTVTELCYLMDKSMSIFPIKNNVIELDEIAKDNEALSKVYDYITDFNQMSSKEVIFNGLSLEELESNFYALQEEYIYWYTVGNVTEYLCKENNYSDSKISSLLEMNIDKIMVNELEKMDVFNLEEQGTK